jgi:hypothetical protein
MSENTPYTIAKPSEKNDYSRRFNKHFDNLFNIAGKASSE